MATTLETASLQAGSIEKHLRIPAELVNKLVYLRQKSESDNALFLRFLEMGLLADTAAKTSIQAEKIAKNVNQDLRDFDQKIEQIAKTVLIKLSQFEQQTAESEQRTRERLIKVIELISGVKK